MAKYSYETSPEEDAALTFITDRSNSFDPEHLTTVAQLVQNSIAGVFRAYCDQCAAEEIETVRLAYQEADTATRARVQTLLTAKAEEAVKEAK